MRRLVELIRSAYAWSNVKSEEGATAVEYGILASLIAVVIILAVTTLGSNLGGYFNAIAAKVHS